MIALETRRCSGPDESLHSSLQFFSSEGTRCQLQGSSSWSLGKAVAFSLHFCAELFSDRNLFLLKQSNGDVKNTMELPFVNSARELTLRPEQRISHILHNFHSCGQVYTVQSKLINVMNWK